MTSSFLFFSDLFLYPLDTIATRAKSHKTKNIKMIEEFQYIIKNEGYSCLYRGVRTSFCTTFFPSIIYFSCYENLNSICKQFFMKNNMRDKAYLIPMISAPVSEFLALLSYMPFDIIRTRLQINSH
jgi:hypothetical protein